MSKYTKNNDILYLSCDDKNKVDVGICAVSRHIKSTQFTTSENRPEQEEHDFPWHTDGKIIPHGYVRQLFDEIEKV